MRKNNNNMEEVERSRIQLLVGLTSAAASGGCAELAKQAGLGPLIEGGPADPRTREEQWRAEHDERQWEKSQREMEKEKYEKEKAEKAKADKAKNKPNRQHPPDIRDTGQAEGSGGC